MAPVWFFTLAAIGTAIAAQPLRARLEGEGIKVSAPSLHFLVDSPLERLHNGGSVGFRFTLSLRERPEGSARSVDIARCTVSYDLWEEQFAVTHVGSTPTSISHLSVESAEAWCVDRLSLSITGIDRDEPFWLELEFVEESMDEQSEASGPFGLALGNLIDIFGGRDREQLLQGREGLGPVRLRDLQ